MSSMSPEVAMAAAQAMLAAQDAKAQPQDPALVPPPSPPQETAPPPQQVSQQGAYAADDSTPPLASQEQLNDEYARKEFALERQLRAQDEADAQGTGPSNVAPPSFAPIQAQGPEDIVDNETMAHRIAQNAAAAHEDQQTLGENAHALYANQAKTQAAIEKEKQPITQELAADIEKRHAHLLGIQAETELEAQQTIHNYHQVNDEMMAMALKQPKDIYGAAGVNSVLGKIAVFLGGAGVNGFHANQNLEQIYRMADFNVQQQKLRYEMLDKVGQGQRSLYGMLNQRLTRSNQVDATLMNMSLEVAKAKILSLSSKYADQTTRQHAQEMALGIDQTIAANNKNIAQTAVQDAMANLQNHAMTNANETRAYAAQLKAHGGTNKLMPIAGFVGGVPAAEHPRLSKMVGGSRTLVAGLNEMEQAIADGKITTFEDLRKFAVNNANLLKGARDFLETGTRIEAGEQSTMQAFQVMPAEGYVNIMLQSMGLLSGDLAAVKTKLEQGKKVVTSATYEAVKTAAPRSATIDSRDPLFAHYDPRRNLVLGQQFLSAATNAVREYTATQRGRELLKNAPSYKAGQ